MKYQSVPTLCAMSLLAACASAPERIVDTVAAPVACEALAGAAPADTVITSAALVAAGAYRPPEDAFEPFPADYSVLPEFCRVTGSIHPTADSDIRFELWLPAKDWNGRFMQTGNGGAAGSLFIFGMIEPLQHGYAVAHNDTGHRGGGGDFSWVPGHPERLVDFQHRSLREMTRVGKSITASHFGRAPDLSVFQGCSTGGRQGLTVAQVYPGDYDAIIAGAPANNWPALMALTIEMENRLVSGALPAQKLGLLKESAIAACDGDDGVSDRVIAMPQVCDFDPVTLRCTGADQSNCLTEPEVKAAGELYAGLVLRDGTTPYPGTGPGSEPGWAAFASPGFRIGSSFYRYAVADDPDWNPATFDPDRGLALARAAAGPELTAFDPDLSAFFDHGGRLLVYHGSTDGLIPYGNSVNYVSQVVDTVGEGEAGQHLRFYLVPGMDHCVFGEGAWAVDWLGAMETWLESGAPPQALAATHPAGASGPPGTPPGKAFTRPLCPWPGAAHFNGEGDPDAATSFSCTEEP